MDAPPRSACHCPLANLESCSGDVEVQVVVRIGGAVVDRAVVVGHDITAPIVPQPVQARLDCVLDPSLPSTPQQELSYSRSVSYHTPSRGSQQGHQLRRPSLDLIVVQPEALMDKGIKLRLTHPVVAHVETATTASLRQDALDHLNSHSASPGPRGSQHDRAVP